MLRGINLGARNRVAMPALKELFEDLGCTDVSTYVQSGNVAFSSSKKPDAVIIAKRIEKDLKVTSPVLVRSAAELAKIVKVNPFDAADSHVTFLENTPPATAVKAIDPDGYAPDRFEVIGHDVFLSCPQGYGRSKLSNAFWERKLSAVATTRNWKTVTALHDLTH